MNAKGRRAAQRTRGARRLRAGIVAGALVSVGIALVPAEAATPLPDMASVTQVVGAPAAWRGAGTGQGIAVALIDAGVTPVQGLDGDGKLIYGPDLSFDSQSPSTAHV